MSSADFGVFGAVRHAIKLNDALEKLGIKKSFSAENAEFGKLGELSKGNIFLGEVFHNTYISVDLLGTKAGAVSNVRVRSAHMDERIVKLDRPFVYAIIDNATNLPVFIGTVMSLEN